MSKAKYPNRDALNQALDHYLDAMFQFVSECLDEPSIRETLRLLSVDDLRKEIEVKDIADLIKKYWSKSFKAKFKIIDRDDIRYYDARSVTSLIIEGRNQVSHQRLRELDAEFTRSQLFLIAEVLGQIKRSDARREVETIRDELFEDTAAQLVTVAVEAEQAKYEKSIADVEKRLATAEKDNKKLSKAVDDNAAELDKKKGELEKISGQLVSIRSSEKENKKQFDSTAKQLEKAQAAHSTCEERLTSTETERDDYKKRLETTSEQLDEVSERLSITSDQFLAVKAERDTSTAHLTAIQKLLTASTISDPSVCPSFKTTSAVRLLDRRGTDKRSYLLELLEQEQSAIIYVQSEERIDQLLKFIGPEKADLIGKCNERTSEAEEAEIFGKLEKGELIAVVSNTAFSTLTSPHRIEHFVFCHLVPGLDEFFRQCEPAFASEKHAYLHLIYNSEQDIEGLVQKYPDREALEKLYPELRKLAGTNGNFIKTETLYNALDMAKLGIETGLAIFEELQLLERNSEGIKLLPPAGKKLDASEIYRRGEKLKKETADFRAFQLEHPIEQIWEEILAKLGVDSEQILRENNTHNYGTRDVANMPRAFQDAPEDAETQSEQSTETIEDNNPVDNEGTARIL
ncbi:hypothetical protein C6499_10480 [Candidatus Poribacteria bacterium]|nr:MAG: hypothetical protein C6499_10480 [Candidatus Poribacteria bacterium]